MVMRSLVCLIAAGLFLNFTSSDLAGQNQAKRIERIKETIAEAGELYKAKDYSEAGKKIEAAQSLMARAIKEGKQTDRETLEKDYKRIAKAHELLSGKGIELLELRPFPNELGPTKEEMAESEEPANLISFQDKIVPLLNQHCGGCHISGKKGEFSMSSYSVLSDALDGEAVVPEKPNESEIIQSMESGAMPPSWASVPKKDIELIKEWIKQGAKFDGDDPKASIEQKTDNRRGRRGR